MAIKERVKAMVPDILKKWEGQKHTTHVLITIKPEESECIAEIQSSLCDALKAAMPKEYIHVSIDDPTNLTATLRKY